MSQICESCAAAKKAEAEALHEAAVKATTNLCPSCGQEIPRIADKCPNCHRIFAREGAEIVPYQHADFMVRLVAYLIDGIGFWLIAGALIVASGIGVPAGITLGSLVYFGVQVAFWMKLGATPGKLVMGIKIVTVDGEPLRIGHCMLRVLGYVAINAFGNILHLLILIKEDKRGVQDMISGTMVVYRDSIPKPQATAGVAPAS
jgi:uncharacterized RDD family membrane protein YckC